MFVNELDRLTRTGAIASLDFYQQRLSPHKGFACPHRLLHGGESCSDYVKRMLHEQSLMAALGQTPRRFRACSTAGRMIQLRATQGRRSGFRCIVIPCCIPF